MEYKRTKYNSMYYVMPTGFNKMQSTEHAAKKQCDYFTYFGRKEIV